MPAGAEDVDAQVFLGNLEVVGLFVCFGEDDDGGGGGVDAALRLRLRNALDAVAAALEAEEAVRAVSLDGEDDFLVAVERRGRGRHHVHRPALCLAVARVHAEEVAREEGRFFAARAGAHLEDGVAPLERVGRQKAGQHGAFCRRHLALQLLQLLLGHRAEVGIVQEGLVAVDVVEQLEVAFGGGFQLTQGGVLPHRRAVARGVA